jgi:hypothetical protein
MARLPLTATDGSASVECWFHLVGALAAIERVSNLLWPSTLDVVVRRRAADVRGALGVLPVIPAALRSTRTLSTQYAKRVGLPPAAGMSPRRLFDPRTGDVCIHSLSLNLFRVLSELAHAAAELAREAR